MILVTGATGLTGQFVVAELVRRGHAVRALCRVPTPIPGAEVALGDLGDVASLTRAARGTTGIVHTACTYVTPAVDLAAMKALVAAREGGPFVYLSSLDVYGLDPPGLVTEDTPLCETYNDYASAKVACERLLTGGTALRAPYIFGPHPTARKRLVPPRLLEGQPLILPGRDEAEWSRMRDVWVDARDLATIVAECVVRPALGPLNVLSGHFSWHDLYAELIRATGSRSTIVHRPVAEITDDELPKKHLYAQSWRFSEARLGEALGPIPRRPLEVTVRDTVSAGAALP